MNRSSQVGIVEESAVADQIPKHAVVRPDAKLWGLLTRRPRWGLSWRGRLTLLAVALILGYVLVLKVHHFLAMTDRVESKILVVEGWIDAYALRAGVAEYKHGQYERIFTTGGPIVGDGGYINDFRTSAGVGGAELLHEGIPAASLQIVASHEIGRDRTYQSAIALRDWFHQHHLSIHSFNLLTEDAHGRRSRLLYQMAFGDEVKVGIISVPNPDYEAARWWRYSEGVRQVLSEGVAYVYAKLFYYP